MLRKASRKLLKQALRLTRAKLVYTRITLTPFTTLYFFVALFSCIVLVILQGVTYADNSAAVRVLDNVLANSNVTRDLTIFSDGTLKVCSRLPKDIESDCSIIAGSNLNSRRSSLSPFETLFSPFSSSGSVLSGRVRRDDDSSKDRHGRKHDSKDSADNDSDQEGNTAEGDRERTDYPTGSNSSERSSSRANNVEIGLSYKCLLSLSWLEDTVHDAKREDVFTLTFHFWLFSLSVVTILNESLPHLVAALLAHVLAAGWASFRVQSSEKLAGIYRRIIVPGPCGGIDHLQNWWELRRLHAIPILVLNVTSLVAIAIVSVKLFRVYASQTFSRVGASTEVHRIYKLVLVFSVGLQLSAFFTLASTSMWIDKICRGVAQLPWLVMGWVCVRRECNIRFIMFCGISLFILSISTLLFFSPLYQFIFGSWSFFATVTVTAYILMVLTSVLGIVCRINFGKGLAHFLQVNEVLEGVDFTPVLFSKQKQEIDPEKLTSNGAEARVITLTNLPSAYRSSKKDRGSSIYSEANGVPIHMSSTPPLLSELAPKSGHTSLTSIWTSRSRRVSDHAQFAKETRVSIKAPEETNQASHPAAPRATARGLPANPRPTQLKDISHL